MMCRLHIPTLGCLQTRQVVLIRVWMGSTMAEVLSALEEARKENASLKDKAAKIC